MCVCVVQREGDCITYQCQWVAQEHESWGVVWKLIGEALYVGVDLVVYGPYLERLLIDLVWDA